MNSNAVILISVQSILSAYFVCGFYSGIFFLVFVAVSDTVCGQLDQWCMDPSQSILPLVIAWSGCLCYSLGIHSLHLILLSMQSISA